MLATSLVQAATITRWSESLDAALSQQQPGTLTSREKIYGSRNLVGIWSGIDDVLQQPMVMDCVHRVLGRQAGLVRVLFFDKPPGRGFPWHRDLTIAVRQHASDLGDFRCPTVKAGQPHLEAPDWLLQQMVTLRVHLDREMNATC